MSDRSPPPFTPSWVDRFINWLDSLPGPFWLIILILYILLSLQSQLANWISGIEIWGQLSPGHFIYQLFTAETLYFWKYLNQDALRGLNAFRPLLDGEANELSELEYRLTHQPARPVLALSIIGALVGGYYGYSVAVINTGSFTLSMASIYGIIGFSIPMILALVFCFRIIQQLKLVSRMYESSAEIDLFDLEPVYALSAHTAKTGLIFLFMIYSNLLISPGSIQIPTALITTIAISVIAFSAFVLPLRGINRRLVAAKKNMLAGINSRIKESFELLEENFDRKEWEGMRGLEKALTALERQKAFVEKIPTWPWQPGTVRSFISAMLLPILLWAVQQFLGRLLIS